MQGSTVPVKLKRCRPPSWKRRAAKRACTDDSVTAKQQSVVDPKAHSEQNVKQSSVTKKFAVSTTSTTPVPAAVVLSGNPKENRLQKRPAAVVAMGGSTARQNSGIVSPMFRTVLLLDRQYKHAPGFREHRIRMHCKIQDFWLSSPHI